MEQPTFDEIVRAWLLHYDDRLPTDRKERRQAFIVLLANLSDYNYTKSDLSTSKKEKIVRSLVNMNHPNKKKLKAWMDLLINDLESAILIYYPTIKIRDDISEDMIEKLGKMEERAEKTRALRTAGSSIPVELDDEDPVTDDSKPKENKSMEITQEMLDEMEGGVEAEWDDSFFKKLGID